MTPLLRVAGAPLRAVLLGGIALYRATIARLLPPRCRFHPSCSAYAAEAIRAHGAVRGLGLAVWRVVRCNPFGSGGIDHVPARTPSSYDAVLHRGAH